MDEQKPQRPAHDAVIAVIGPLFGLISAIQSMFQPFVGQGPKALVLTLAALAMVVGSVVAYRRGRTRRVSLAVTGLLVVSCVGAGIGVGSLLRSHDDTRAGSPPCSTTPTTAPTQLTT
ncbi:MAG TPA: hypothetical protein VM677_16180, partial [Actinokineospora sp.]|nr:hypothetical protein [Actinokineospora sp.]